MTVPSASLSVTVNCETMKPDELANLLTSSASTATRTPVFNPPSDADSVREAEFQANYWLYTGSASAVADDFGPYNDAMSSDHMAKKDVVVRQFLNPFSVTKTNLTDHALKHYIRREILNNICVVGLSDTQNEGNGKGLVAKVGGGLFALNNNGPDYFKYGDVVVYDVPDIEVSGHNVTTEPCSRLISRSLGSYIPYSARKFVEACIPDVGDRKEEFVTTTYGLGGAAATFDAIVSSQLFQDAVDINEKIRLIRNLAVNYGYDYPNENSIRALFDSTEMKKYMFQNSFDGTDVALYYFLSNIGDANCCNTFYQLLKQAARVYGNPDACKFHEEVVNLQHDILLDHLTRKKGICMKPGGPGEKIAVMLT